MGRITELQDEVCRRKNHVTQMDHQIHTLNENISTLTKELELKGKEVLKIRSEANQQIRYALVLKTAESGAGPLRRAGTIPCCDVVSVRKRLPRQSEKRLLSSASHFVCAC